MSISSVPLVPKHPDGTLHVLVIGRVSTEQQPISNIDAGYEYAERELQRNYGGPMTVKHLGEQGSGMLTERATIREAREEIKSGNWDVVLMEDISKPYRNPRWQFDFVQDAFDYGVRLIAPGDNLDTADDDWELALTIAIVRHGLHIPDTRRRVRRTATHTFHKGGMVLKVRYGYRRLSKEEAESGQFGPKDLRIAKVPECMATIQEMRSRVLNGESYVAIAEWLRSSGIETGPYVSTGVWTDKLIEDLLRDPILSGIRTFRDTIYKPVFRTGKHKRETNEEPESHYVPELAHMTVEEQEELWRVMDARAPGGKATSRGAKRRNVRRTQTYWPGRSVVCIACGERMYYAGECLRCQNSRPNAVNKCWNHLQLSAALTRERVAGWLADYLDGTPQLRGMVGDVVFDNVQRIRRNQADNSLIHEKLKGVRVRAAKFLQQLSSDGDVDRLLHECQVMEKALARVQQWAIAQPIKTIEDFALLSKEQTGARLREVLPVLLNTSYEVADFMRTMFPQFTIQPVQALDTTLVRPRGKLIFRPSALFGPAQETEAAQFPDMEVVLDLFEPPEHIRHLEACVAIKLANPRRSYEKIATTLGIGKMTVKRALHYAQLMESGGISEPYRNLYSCPEQGSRWHKRRKAS